MVRGKVTGSRGQAGAPEEPAAALAGAPPRADGGGYEVALTFDASCDLVPGDAVAFRAASDRRVLGVPPLGTLEKSRAARRVRPAEPRFLARNRPVRGLPVEAPAPGGGKPLERFASNPYLEAGRD